MKLFLNILFVCLTTVCSGLQTVAQYISEPVDTTATTSRQGIVSHLTNSNSAITIDAPEALLLRAQAVEEEAQVEEDEIEADEADSDEAQEEMRKQRPHGKMAGYRVQVYADNNVRSAKSEARHREKAISQIFPAYTTYVTYASPFWRLRVGDFRSQYEAEKAAAEIKRQFPGYAREVRVVRDHVNAR